ncbi:MAG: PDZ domain-containing protein [Bacteroidales bacterium]|nr:PDZ domain-containing protein [Bacteroidales bacterium]
MEKNRSRVLQYILVILVGIYVGISIFRLVKPSGRSVDINAVNSDWAKLMLVLQSVDNGYVENIDHAAVTEDILPKIMEELDPHSVYLPPMELEKAEESLQGGFDGIGIQFNVPNDTIVITSVISGGPSERAGLMTGDRIIKVGERVVAGVKMAQDTMVSLMKGPRGTNVKITLNRMGEKEPLVFDIIRDKIPVKSVDVAFMINDTTGFVKLSKFARTSYPEFITALATLKSKGMRKLIFDLRDNTGGYLDQALMLCNEFLQKGDLIFYMEGVHRPRQDMFADGSGLCKDVELAVLINEYSASSSEIFAGAMQDNDRAMIYGVRSFGKGLVQESINFSDGSGIRLTTARYYTPTGRCIQKPYESYAEDFYERYTNGELFSADSIKVNDSLKYETPKGRIVYGGGGIIPDVFVPLDTVGVTEYLIKCNRQSMQIRFANKIADENRTEMRSLNDMQSIEAFLNRLNLESRFKRFTSEAGIVPKDSEWKISGKIIMTQVRALISRYTPLGDDAFYPIYLKTDNVVKIALGE